MLVFHLLFQAAEKLEKNDTKLLINKSVPYILRKKEKKQPMLRISYTRTYKIY